MFDKIVFISDHAATIKLKDSENITMNLMNLHIVFEDDTKKVLGEVNDVKGDTVNASFLGEIVDGKFLGGTIRKPRLDAKIRVINDDEILLITGKDEQGYMPLGKTPFYDGSPVYLDVNNFFSGHFAIMGNSGSGKSCGVSRLFQNMFHDSRLNPCNANIIMIDSSGEYYNAFSNLGSISPNYHYRFITTNVKDNHNEKLRIPIYLLNEADLALLLQVTSHSQLPIVERMRKLALVFSQKDVDINNYKNHLIAKAIMTILYTNESGPNKRNEIFSVLASCSTPQFNLETVVQGIGYTRKFRECFLIDNSGNFSESVLITEYVSSFINDELEAYEPQEGVFYTLDTLEKALNFTLISEGWLRNKNTYGDAVTLKVRLHSLIVSNNAKFFDVKQYLTVEQYLNTLVNGDNIKYQFVNINLDDVDDDFAKVITKIYSRLIFDYSKGLTERASMPFHLVIEEAHRYIQNDNDRFLIGYNIFERIAKEGRKYGVILGIITQRPVELSDTVISQCSNFLIFKMNHPVDVDYIRKMVPNISDEIVEKQKTLQSGTCLGFGSAFKIPMIVKMEMPDPAPWSGNCDVVSFWGGGSAIGNMMAQNGTILNIPTGGLFSPTPVESAENDADKKEASSNALVKMKVDEPEAPSMHAGQFGLVDAGEEEIKVPTTDNGVSLVSLAGENKGAEGTNSKESTGIPDGPVVLPIQTEGISVVNLADASAQKPQVDSDVVAPTLVAFNPGTVPVVEEEKKPEVVENPLSNLVTFTTNDSNPAGNNSANLNTNEVIKTNDANASSNGQGATSELTVAAAPSTEMGSSNVTAAPNINVNLFENTGNGDVDDSESTGGVSFTSNEPSVLGTPVALENVTAAPNLVNMNSSPAGAFEAPSLVDLSNNGSSGINAKASLVDFNSSLMRGSLVPNMDRHLNDTFGKPDLMDFNVNNNVDQNGNFSALDVINNLTTQSSGNGGFSPSDMNFGGQQPVNNSGGNNASVSLPPPLVSFLNQ